VVARTGDAILSPLLVIMWSCGFCNVILRQ
jgi:hypothetical protein